LHPEIRHKSSKQNVKEPVKKEAPSTIGKARLRDESAWCWFGKQFIMFLQVLFLLCCKILSFMGAGIPLLMENTQKFSDSESRSNGIIAKSSMREIQRCENHAKRPPDEKVASYLGSGRWPQPNSQELRSKVVAALQTRGGSSAIVSRATFVAEPMS
jgi:hypothetical protein